MTLKSLRGMTLEELQVACIEAGLPKYRATQLFSWVQGKGVSSWTDMLNVPVNVREKLARTVSFGAIKILREQGAGDGTRKFLFELPDGECLESVLMHYDRKYSRDRATVCVSTQVGCAMGCSFCATGLGGLVRNLDASEIVGQVLDIVKSGRESDPEFKVTNVVFMGMGEPLQNYRNLARSIVLLNDNDGQNIGMRRMTVSTCGVLPGILKIAHDFPQITLAISLHAPNDDIRNLLVPINRQYPLQELLSVCRKYIDITNRKVTFEYVLIKGLNSTPEHARELVALVKGLLCTINLIPVNQVNESEFRRPTYTEIESFRKILTEAGVENFLREEKGTDIDAACGQLRKRRGDAVGGDTT